MYDFPTCNMTFIIPGCVIISNKCCEIEQTMIMIQSEGDDSETTKAYGM